MISIEGKIVKGIGGFYYVDTADGRYECRARGSFRKENIVPLVGDRVVISANENSMTGAVDVIKERKNVLLRPPVANVSQIAIVIATANPKPNLYLIDKVIASAELAEIEIIICVNKIDIDKGQNICDIYSNAGFCTIELSAKNGNNIDELRDKLADNITVFAGNSGVGKSSLLNCITESCAFETGEVSDKVERGKHTTRHSELVKLKNGGYIIDTPGFGNLDFSLLESDNISALFREFEPYVDNCRFRDCTHTGEPGCAVLNEVEKNISRERYDSYLKIVEEVKKSDRKY